MIILVHFLHKAALFDFNFRKVKFFSSAWNPFSAEIKMSVLCSTPKERSSTSNWPQIARDSIYYIIMLLYYNIKPWRLAAEALKPQFLYNLDGVILSCSSNVIPWNISPAEIQWVKKGFFLFSSFAPPVQLPLCHYISLCCDQEKKSLVTARDADWFLYSLMAAIRSKIGA